MLKSFLNQSQFLVITHNRQTIGAAGTLYGVTMEADKVSRIMSMRFKEHHRVEASQADLSRRSALAQEESPSQSAAEPAAVEGPQTGDPPPATTG